MNVKQKARITLQHNQHRVDGPPDLVLWINSLQRVPADGEVKNAAFMTRLENYFVNCAITGDEILLSELKYWNVDLQEPYKNAKVGLDRYTEILASP